VQAQIASLIVSGAKGFGMDLDQEVTNTQVPSLPESASIPNDGVRTQSGMSSTPTEMPKRAFGHDSLVTVRLSEPPSLHINTSIPLNPLPSRRTVYGIDYTPTQVMTKKLEEEEEDGDMDKEPGAPAPMLGPNLQEELEQSDLDSEEGEQDGSESPIERSSSESDKVDWEQLQKTEDMESKDQDADNVSASLAFAFDIASNYAEL